VNDSRVLEYHHLKASGHRVASIFEIGSVESNI
jgi:hypothetical protein